MTSPPGGIKFLIMIIRRAFLIALMVLIPVAALGGSDPSMPSLESFSIRPITGNDFRSFVEVFSEMRGPLRSEILKDRKTEFESADPLKYVAKIKGEKDVKKMLKKHALTWDGFSELMGNVVLAYFSIQPQETKASLIRRLADYGLEMNQAQIPPEYRDVIRQFMKTDQGSAIAAMALDFVLQIPEENVAMARENKRTLDAMFYTNLWKDRI
ncbi:MAG: hypothetical protein JXA24_01060 [Proteobacteria bacterium]|nr:hypothetical protein [Pseudomonadota bacterium]